jgi:hypothetical protein
MPLHVVPEALAAVAAVVWLLLLLALQAGPAVGVVDSRR